MQIFWNSKYKTIVALIFVAALYYISGKFGLGLAVINPSATPIWAPTGIALAAILIFGYRIVPAIFLGAFLVNNSTAGTITTSLLIAFGNTLEAVIGAYLVTKFANGLHAFDQVVDIFKFTFFAAILATTISANIGVITLITGGLAQWQEFIPIWTTWWLGNMGGSLVFAPLFFAWKTHPPTHFNYKQVVYFLLSLFGLFIITGIVFSGTVPYPYLYIPIGVWIAFWFGQKGATIATVLVAGLTIFYTLQGIGPFAGTSINQSLIQLQLFINIFSLTALVFAATVLAIRKGESTLMFHEQRFQALIEKSYDGVVLIDPTSKILYASSSVKRLLGYDPKELEGTTGFNLVIPEDRSMTMAALAKVTLKPGGVIKVEYRAQRKDKKIIWIEATGTNLLFEPTVNAVVVNFRDITEKKIAQEKLLHEKRRDEAMLASIGDGIIATDNKGRITMVNQAACQMLGWEEKNLVGKMFVEAIRMEDESGKSLPIDDRPMTRVLSQGKKIIVSKTNYYVRKDGTKIPIRFTLTAIRLNGQIVGTIEVFHDITREKELDRAKDDFISLASHELRTPMTAIKGILSMISHGDYGVVNKELQRPFANISVSAERQIHLINDLLNVSRLQTGRIDYNLTNFAIGQAIQETCAILEPIAQQRGVKIKMKETQDGIVQADIEWTKHILNNLIGNALKFTNKGTITVSYHYEKNMVHIAITDTGIGISSEDQEKLFGKFQQLSDQQSGKPPGSGLGLYISRALARNMGGDLFLKESHKGKGSTFILQIPEAKTAYAEKIKAEIKKQKEIAFSKRNE